MSYVYLLTPLLAWFVAGVLKFAINSARSKSLAFSAIGYGGLPSNHAAMVSSIASLIALREGFDQPAFGAAFVLAIIVILDANSLRRQVGLHAVAINRLNSKSDQVMREKIGHTKIELFAGTLVGLAVAWCVDVTLP